MRVGIWIAALFAASPVFAEPPQHIPPHDPLLPLWDAVRYTPSTVDNDRLPDFARAGSGAGDDSRSTGLSFGPLHADSETINGHRRVHYRVDGLQLFGGDIGGSVSHRGAMLTLHWRARDN